MKKIIIVLLAITITFGVSNIFAQGKLKFGHINSQELLEKLPKKDSAQKVLESYAKELEDQLRLMENELNAKLSEYESQKSTYSDPIRKDKEDALMGMQQRIQAFQQNAQQDLQQKEVDLLNPIWEEIQNVITEVGTENGFMYIYDVTTLLYHSDASEDVTPLVKKKLGIQ